MIDHFIEKSQQQNRTKILQAAVGLRSDLKSPQDIDFQELHLEADRLNLEGLE